MRIIPVIDLRDGVAVHARRGERARYRPVASVLAAEPDPCALLDGFLALHPFPIVYLADLDAIQGRDPQESTLRALQERHPEVEFWLDAGAHGPGLARPGIVPVIGTESGGDGRPARELESKGERAILSLDFGEDGILGAAGVLNHPEWWPRDVIVMPLRRVGSDAGPDLDLLRRCSGLSAGRHSLHLAGGVRGTDDLRRIRAAGAAGALIASALHSGALGAAALSGIEPG